MTRFSVRIGDEVATYTVTADDVLASSTSDMVAVGLKNAIDNLGIADLTVDYDSLNPGQLDFSNAGADDLTVSAQFVNANAGGLGRDGQH